MCPHSLQNYRISDFVISTFRLESKFIANWTNRLMTSRYSNGLMGFWRHFSLLQKLPCKSHRLIPPSPVAHETFTILLFLPLPKGLIFMITSILILSIVMHFCIYGNVYLKHTDGQEVFSLWNPS